MKINNIIEDLEATNAIREFRGVKGLAAPRNPICFWKAALCVLACTKEDGCMTIDDIRKGFKKVGIHFGSDQAQFTLLVKASEGHAPDPIRREYTKTLPYLAKFLELYASWDEKEGPTLGRRTIRVFGFLNVKRARIILLSEFPELKEFMQILLKRPVSINV